MAAYEFLEEALNPARLKALSGKTKGTGGPAVSLPDGTSVNRDIIVAALENIIASGTANCAQLVQALSDQRVHIRYGALMALQRITGIKEPDFYPFQEPNSPHNLKAIERWKERCAGFSSDSQ
jgi:hypothetical protein